MTRKKKLYSTLAFLPLYLFTLLFVAGPMILMLVLSFSEREGWGAGDAFTFANYLNIFTGTYLNVFVTSLKLAAVSTAAAVLLGYPFGVCTAFTKGRLRSFIVTSQMIPYWVNSLLRLYGWIIIFRSEGLLDRLLMFLHITDEPLKLLYTYPAVVVGMIYVLLPFMFISVYQVAEKLDGALLEASHDLGAGKVRTFFEVILPLTLPGLKTGIVLTFIPSMGLFFIAQILGGNKIVLVGSLIEELLMKAHNKPQAAALSVVLMILTGAVCVLMMAKKKHGGKRG